jgi:hypothetical protein
VAQRKRKVFPLSPKQMEVVNAMRPTSAYVVEVLPSKVAVGVDMDYVIEGVSPRMDVLAATMNFLITIEAVIRDKTWVDHRRWVLNRESPTVKRCFK